MAYDKAVDSGVLDAGLKSIADAIRTKGGTSDVMAFPAGFVAAIEAIETGGTLKYATGSASVKASKTYSVTGLAFTPVFAFMHMTGQYGSISVGAPDASFSVYGSSNNFSNTFTATEGGFTFTGTANIYGNGTLVWHAYGL